MRNGNVDFSVGFSVVCSGSYPTYEEWKLRRRLDGLLIDDVLILPMRNGNSLKNTPSLLETSFLSYL